MTLSLTSSAELVYSLGGSIVSVDVMPPTKPEITRSGLGCHELDHRGNLILSPVAHGTPAQKRDALIDSILQKRLWAYFAREAVTEVAARGCINPRAKMMMLPIGVLVDFRVPTAAEGGLEGVLERYGRDEGDRLARHLDMYATVVEFLKPRVDQVPEIEEMIALYCKEDAFIVVLAPSMLSSRAPSSQGQSSSGSSGFVTPAKVEGERDIGLALSCIFNKLEESPSTLQIPSGLPYP